MTWLIATPAYAIFGLGDIVFDPTNFGEMLTQTTHMVTQIEKATATYNQIVTTYNRITQQYNQMVTNAKYLTNLSSYRQAVTPWQGMATTNTYGNTGSWIAAVNSGINTFAAWNTASFPRQLYGLAMSKVPAPQRPQLQAEYATLELQDGTAQAAMQIIGALRLHGVQNEGMLSDIAAASESGNPDLNTETAILNKINIANMVIARQAGDTNKILVAQAEQALVEAKMQHDAAASAVANDIAFRTTGMATLRAQHAGFADAMRNFRMP